MVRASCWLRSDCCQKKLVSLWINQHAALLSGLCRYKPFTVFGKSCDHSGFQPIQQASLDIMFQGQRSSWPDGPHSSLSCDSNVSAWSLIYQRSTNTLIPADRAIDCLPPKMAHLSKANPRGEYVCLRWLMCTILFCPAAEEYGRHPNGWLWPVCGQWLYTQGYSYPHLRTKLFRTFKGNLMELSRYGNWLVSSLSGHDI